MSDSGALWAQKPGIARARDRLRLGERLMMQAGDTSPVQSPWQGLARLAQGLVGGYEAKGADAEFAASAEADRALMAQLLAPPPGAPQMAPEPQPQQPMTAPQQPVAQRALAPTEYEPLIQAASQETGIPPQLLTGLFAQESSFRPDARNPRSTATGIGQVLDSTAANPGFGLPPLSPEARLDPAQAIPWSARYLAARGRGLGVTDWNDPQQAERGLRAYGENTPEYARAVMQRAGMGGDTIPAQNPAQGAPQTRTGEAASVYAAQAADYQRKAQAAIAGGRTDLAQIFQQQAQMAQQMALSRQPQPDETTRLLMAAGYQPGTPEFQQAARGILEARTRGPQTNVTVSGGTSYGTQPPAGWRYVREPTPTGGETVRLEEIPGGPAEQARLEKDRKQGQRDEGTARSGSVVTQDIGRILKLMDDANLPTAGMGATWLSNIPGTAASDIKSLVDGIGANIAFDRLQQMRESSPTGAALGAVSDTENRMLMSAYGSLSQSQSPAQFRENLNRLNTIYMDIIHGKGKWQEMRPSPPATGGADGWSIKPVQ